MNTSSTMDTPRLIEAPFDLRVIEGIRPITRGELDWTIEIGFDLTHVDTSEITDMSSLFEYATEIHGDISNWDTSSVTNMKKMFFYAKNFNQPLNWDTSNVTDMSWMFYNARTFNQTLYWDTSKVLHMATNIFEYSKGGVVQPATVKPAPARWCISTLLCRMVGVFKKQPQKGKI